MTREYAGIETSNEFQETIYGYDGHGRLQAKHTPEQDANKFTTYTYFADDNPQTITDARGAAKQYQYNNLGLIQQISYQSPSQVPIIYNEPIIMQVSENVDGSIYKLAFRGFNFDSNAELSVDIIINNGTQQQNLRYSNLERSTENGEQVLKFDIASDPNLYNYVNTNSYTMTFSVINPNTNKRTQSVLIDYLNGSSGRYVRILSSMPSRYYTVSETPTVSFSYDNLGNRISMNDGFGTVAYEYNELSQITAETRQFNETVPNAPLPNNQFKIQYSYGLAGQLTSLTEPFGEIISYGHDKTGRLKSVSGNRVNEGVQLNYVTDAKYRAWGAVKRLDYGNNTYVGMDYNNRLQAENYTLANVSSSVIDYQSYQYYSDGRLKFSSPSANSNFDRLYEYDFLGRLTTAKTGNESRGQTESNPNNRPYRMTLGYNQFGDITSQQRLHWGATFSSTFQFQNQKMTSETKTSLIPGWVAQTATTNYPHDEDGRPTDDDRQYNADGKISYIAKEEEEPVDGNASYFWHGSSIKYDGNGDIIKTVKDGNIEGWWTYTERRAFRIRSSVIGEVITKFELEWNDGYNGYFSYRKDRRHIYANGKEIAERRIDVGVRIPFDATVLKISDASGVDKSEMTLLGDGFSTLSLTLDPFGADVGTNTAYPPPSGNPDPQNNPDCVWNDYDDYDCDFPEGYDEPENEDQEAGSLPENTCYVDGVEADCNEVAENPELYESDDVALEDEDKAPSEEGPQSVWDNDDQSNQPSETEEREFEVEYSGMNARIRGEITVNITMPMPRLSSWDLRRETSQQDDRLQVSSDTKISNKITPRRLPQEDCDFLINYKFGSMNSVVATKTEPQNHPRLKGGNRENAHLAKMGTLHIYGNEAGTVRNSPLYLPRDVNGKPPTFVNDNLYQEPNNTTWTNLFRWKYTNGVVVEFFHVGGTYGGTRDGKKLGEAFARYNRNGVPTLTGSTNAAGSMQIGYIGGLGGGTGNGETGGDYIHTHISFKLSGKYVDPKSLFCAGYSNDGMQR